MVSTVYPSTSSGLPQCTYFRSQVLYNAATGLYVLWANSVSCKASTCPNGECLDYAISTAPAPEGPFTFVKMARAADLTAGLGDFALFADDDGTGYIVLCNLINGAGPRDMYVFPLSSDYLKFEAQRVLLPGPKLVEAPSFFKRGPNYFILLGGCTCMGLYGGGVAALTAPHPLGPWTSVSSQIDPGCPMLKQSTCFEMGPGAICNPISQAQQNFVIEVPLVSGDTAFVWTGDKWQQSPDHMYDQQPQTWLPLVFDATTGNIQPFSYVGNFTLDVAV